MNLYQVEICLNFPAQPPRETPPPPGVPPYDFISRFFDLGEGIDEDPVTGSAHCCLAPYWQGRLQKDRLQAFQASRRDGDLTLQVQEDRVLIGGRAVTVLEGRLLPVEEDGGGPASLGP